jgi:hypothetical protein
VVVADADASASADDSRPSTWVSSPSTAARSSPVADIVVIGRTLDVVVPAARTIVTGAAVVADGRPDVGDAEPQPARIAVASTAAAVRVVGFTPANVTAGCGSAVVEM